MHIYRENQIYICIGINELLIPLRVGPVYRRGTPADVLAPDGLTPSAGTLVIENLDIFSF